MDVMTIKQMFTNRNFIVFALTFLALFILQSFYWSKMDENFNNCWSNSENCNVYQFAKHSTIRPIEPSNSSSKSIMVLEGHGNNFLSPRMWCTVESASHFNPKTLISVFVTSPFIYKTPSMEAVIKNENIQIVHLNVSKLFQGSPLQEWYRKRRWEESRWPKSHLNDALRWMLLWQYGGIYLDLDVIVMRNLDNLGNFTGMESSKYLGAGVLGFDTPRHPIVSACLNQISNHFDGTVWGANGPELLTKVLEDRCGMEMQSSKCPNCPYMPVDGNPKIYPKCPDMRIFPSKAFYNIPWWRWMDFLDEKRENITKTFSDKNIYVLHVWNTHMHNKPINLHSKSLYATAIRENCPHLAKVIGNIF